MMTKDIFKPEILAELTVRYQRFSSSPGVVTLEGDCLVFDAPTARAYQPGSSIGGYPCPHKYQFNVISGHDVNGRPSRWYPLTKWFNELGILESVQALSHPLHETLPEGG